MVSHEVFLSLPGGAAAASAAAAVASQGGSASAAAAAAASAAPGSAAASAASAAAASGKVANIYHALSARKDDDRNVQYGWPDSFHRVAVMKESLPWISPSES